MKWHPDKHQDAKAKQIAEEKFKDIAEAFDVLSDKDKRKVYDQFGEEGVKAQASGGGQYSGVDPSELFSRFFGTDSPFRFFFDDEMGGGMPQGATFIQMGGMGPSGFSRGGFNNSGAQSFSGSRPSPPPETRCSPIDLNLTLEELYSGCKKRLKVSRMRWHGNERSREERILEIDIKPGWKDGTRVKFDGEGDQDAPRARPGDIAFIVKSKPHNSFTRDGSHLIHRVTIPLARAFQGFVVPIKTLDGRELKVSVESIVNPKTRRIVPNEGMPISKRPGERGDLILEFDIVFPKQLSEDQKRSMVKILSNCQ